MLLSSCNLPSQKVEDFTPLPFIISADDGQSVTEVWKSMRGDTITSGRFNPRIQLNRWWVKTQVKNSSNIKYEFFLILNNPHINTIEVYALYFQINLFKPEKGSEQRMGDTTEDYPRQWKVNST